MKCGSGCVNNAITATWLILFDRKSSTGIADSSGKPTGTEGVEVPWLSEFTFHSPSPPGHWQLKGLYFLYFQHFSILDEFHECYMILQGILYERELINWYILLSKYGCMFLMNWDEYLQSAQARVKETCGQLALLEAPLDQLYSDSVAALTDHMYDVLALLRIIWTHSQHYHRPSVSLSHCMHCLT